MRALNKEESPRAPPTSLEWLTADKLLELIAHDLNNLCHGAISYLDLALEPTATPELRAKFGAQARALVHRASQFTPTLRVLQELRSADLSGASPPLSEALEHARADALRRHEGAALEVDRAGDAWDARVRGGRWVAVALAHVLDNAVQFSRDGKTGRAHATAVRDGGFARISVRDESRGFAQGQEAYALRRFSEPGKVSGGGLGLAIVRIVAERAGGTAEAAASKEPKGTVITLRLPAVP